MVRFVCRGFTTTVAVCDFDPPVPAQASVYEVVCVSRTGYPPLGEAVGTLLPFSVHDVAFAVAQYKIVELLVPV
jgi:hypothetical protein